MNTVALVVGYVVLFFIALFLLAVACGVVWLGLQCSHRIARNKRFYKTMFRHSNYELSYHCVKYLQQWPAPSQNLDDLERWFHIEGLDELGKKWETLKRR